MPPDENAFRRIRETAFAHRCAFERALLARCAGCSLARPVLMAEREAFGCASAQASDRCRAYRQRLREAARFALRIDGDGPLPFGKEIRLQCGGLIGLDESLGSPEDTPRGDALPGDALPGDAVARAAPLTGVADADRLLRDALERYDSLDRLPWSRIIRAVVRYQPRPARLR